MWKSLDVKKKKDRERLWLSFKRWESKMSSVKDDPRANSVKNSCEPCFHLISNPARHCFGRLYLIWSVVKILNADILAFFVTTLMLHSNYSRLTFNYNLKFLKKLYCWLCILPTSCFLIDALENHFKKVWLAVLNLWLWLPAHFLGPLRSAEVGQLSFSSGLNVSRVGDQFLEQRQAFLESPDAMTSFQILL